LAETAAYDSLCTKANGFDDAAGLRNGNLTVFAGYARIACRRLKNEFAVKNHRPTFLLQDITQLL
jgi:hypothetical protein